MPNKTALNWGYHKRSEHENTSHPREQERKEINEQELRDTFIRFLRQLHFHLIVYVLLLTRAVVFISPKRGG